MREDFNEKPRGKETARRPTHRWQDRIMSDLGEAELI
jgi:hypothetical protein